MERENQKPRLAGAALSEAWAALQSREPRESWRALLAAGDVDDVAAGTEIFREGRPAQVGAILDGIARVYQVSPSGRAITGRYAHAGDLVGLAAALSGSDRWGANAVTDVRVAFVALDRIRSVALEDAAFAWAIAKETARAFQSLGAMADAARGGTVSRIAGHLLESRQQTPDGRVIARVSHQRLADAVGTAREVVTRTLGSFRDAGLIETHRGSVVVCDEAALARIAAGDDLPAE